VRRQLTCACTPVCMSALEHHQLITNSSVTALIVAAANGTAAPPYSAQLP